MPDELRRNQSLAVYVFAFCLHNGPARPSARTHEAPSHSVLHSRTSLPLLPATAALPKAVFHLLIAPPHEGPGWGGTPSI